MGQTGLERAKGLRAGSEGSSHLSYTNFDYSDDELELLRAVETYKRVNSTCSIPYSEVLWILKQLGYRKTEQSQVKI